MLMTGAKPLSRAGPAALSWAQAINCIQIAIGNITSHTICMRIYIYVCIAIACCQCLLPICRVLLLHSNGRRITECPLFAPWGTAQSGVSEPESSDGDLRGNLNPTTPVVVIPLSEWQIAGSLNANGWKV